MVPWLVAKRCRAEQLDQGVTVENIVAKEDDGETSRTLFTRSNQHFADYSTHVAGSRRQEASSWMWDHTVETHNGVISDNPREDFQFRVEEAVRLESIENGGLRLGDKLRRKVVSLNRKEEHYQPRLVRPNFHAN